MMNDEWHLDGTSLVICTRIREPIHPRDAYKLQGRNARNLELLGLYQAPASPNCIVVML